MRHFVSYVIHSPKRDGPLQADAPMEDQVFAELPLQFHQVHAFRLYGIEDVQTDKNWDGVTRLNTK